MTAKMIMDLPQTLQKIRRIAYEVYEQNFEEQEIVLAGILGQGYEMGKLLAQEIQQISKIEVTTVLINFDKNSPYEQSAVFDCDERFLEKKTIVVVDDVLHTGRTLAYSLAPFLSIPVKRLQVAIMVDRGYRRFPIQADFVGYRLSTTLNDQIEVKLTGEGEKGIFLN